ncbi:MAG: 5-formyltetrahydrofolate cyclo-ligase [Armatimonadetes bacterium]|nr:5-formyltetrahydrofolate cyclo-ligase [Armatimonadota bacterium]MDW8154255.1 5-formyltetrahydrofolate cyclo-ligase [Armatimonadota bacterium]
MSVAVCKQELRRRITRARVAEPDKEAKSRAILEKVFRLPQFQQARTVLFYVDAGSEVRTRPFLPRAMAMGKRVAVPYCTRDERGQDVLQLFVLQDLAELEPGSFGILEPKPVLRAGRALTAQEVDMVLVPGVVFDRQGGRLGHGWGYYDRLLSGMRPDCWLVGLAYECQVVEEVPMEPQDIYLDLVITERTTYVGRRWLARAGGRA